MISQRKEEEEEQKYRYDKQKKNSKGIEITDKKTYQHGPFTSSN